jgi:hypothetical protein
LKACWDVLGSQDAGAALRAVWDLAAAPRESVSFLAERLRPARAADPALVARLVGRLDAPAFEDRERAAEELKGLGDAIEADLRKVLAGEPAAEVRRRVDSLLEYFEQSPERQRNRRAVQALEYAGTPEAGKLLEALAGGAPAARLTAEARSSVGRLRAR